MSAKMKKAMASLGLFIFHRDLRLDDNSALISLSEQVDSVLPCVILDPVFLEKHSSQHHRQFLYDCLEDVDKQLSSRDGRLYVFSGDTKTIVQSLASLLSCSHASINKDYSPFGKAREQIFTQLNNQGILSFTHLFH